MERIFSGMCMFGLWETITEFLPEFFLDICSDRFQTFNADRTTTGIYVTLNAVNPDLLARRANRIKIRLSKKDSTTADSDIIRRRWFPIDIDPVRPSGVSSSEEEHENALAKADIIKEYLSELCWPDPICADSGNGAHLLYRVDLPNEPEIRDLIKDALNTLSVLFTDSK